jgi:hypothetical protein
MWFLVWWLLVCMDHANDDDAIEKGVYKVEFTHSINHTH